jgi:uncharacterized membrane protein YfhO
LERQAKKERRIKIMVRVEELREENRKLKAKNEVLDEIKTIESEKKKLLKENDILKHPYKNKFLDKMQEFSKGLLKVAENYANNFKDKPIIKQESNNENNKSQDLVEKNIKITKVNEESLVDYYKKVPNKIQNILG